TPVKTSAVARVEAPAVEAAVSTAVATAVATPVADLVGFSVQRADAAQGNDGRVVAVEPEPNGVLGASRRTGCQQAGSRKRGGEPVPVQHGDASRLMLSLN